MISIDSAGISALAHRILGHFPDVLSLRVGGSFGRGNSDEFSDLDLFVTIESSAYEDFLRVGHRQILELLGPIQIMRGPFVVSGFGDSSTSYILDHGIVDLMSMADQDVQPHLMKKGLPMPVYDKTGRVSRALQISESLDIPWQAIAEDAAVWAWFRLYKTLKEVSRGSVLQANRYLSDARESLVTLWRCEKGVVPRGFNFSEPLRGLESEFREDFWNQYGSIMHPSRESCCTQLVENLLGQLRRSVTRLSIDSVSSDALDTLASVCAEAPRSGG